MAEIIVSGGRDAIHCAIYLKGGPEAIKAIVDRLPFSYEMPCGEVYALRKIQYLPEEDMPCPCGDPSHYFVKYGR